MSNLQIIVWKVEHGSAIFAKCPNGLSILLDAGSSPYFSPAIWLKRRWSINQVNLFILSHADHDHISDIINVDKLLNPAIFLRNKSVPQDLIFPTYPPERDPHKHYYKFDNRYNQELPTDSPYRFIPESNWGYVKIKTHQNLAPEQPFTNLNDYSIVANLLYGNLQFMFPGDLESPGWSALLDHDDFRNICTPSSANPKEIRILVAPHHGRKAGVYMPFLELFSPHLTIISDKYGVEYTDYDSYRLSSIGYSVYDNEKGVSETRKIVTTKTNNYIYIESDGQSIRVVV